MSSYPDNSTWSGTSPGFDRQADGEAYDMPIAFTHVDGRVITIDIHTTIGGEVVDSTGERIPGTEDAFVSMVDDAYSDYFTADGPTLPEPSDLTRRFWVYDTSVSYGAGPDEDHLAFQHELEESDNFVVDLDYFETWADMPEHSVTDVLDRQAKGFITGTLQHIDLEDAYRKITSKAQETRRRPNSRNSLSISSSPRV